MYSELVAIEVILEICRLKPAPVNHKLALSPLHRQVPHFQRVVLNERPPRLDLVAHEDGEDGVGVDVVLDLHAEEAALGWVHRGLPELHRVHLAEALVALDREPNLTRGSRLTTFMTLESSPEPIREAVSPLPHPSPWRSFPRLQPLWAP